MRIPAGIFLAGFAAWVLGWIFHFGSTLINDEYAAINYFYRVLRTHHFYPTPDKLHKPLSVLMGVFAWLVESPLGYEAAVAVFAVALVALCFLAVRRELRAGAALAAGLAVALNPEAMYYSATGNTILPFCALSFLGLLAVLSREDSPKWLWVYAGTFFLAGLIRPEAWLFAGPVIVWWWPGRDRRAGVRVLIALAIIALGPLIWFGKDYWINGNFLHGFAVATRDKKIGVGAPFSAWDTLAFFWIRIPNEISLPVAAGGLLGALLFLWRRGLRGLAHPFLVFPSLVSAYVWLIVYLGVYPVQRYWYFDSIFSMIFCLYLVQWLFQRLHFNFSEAARSALFFAALFLAAGFFLARPESSPADGRWLLLGAGSATIALAVIMAWPRFFLRRPGSHLAVAAAVFLGLAYLIFIGGFYQQKIAELDLEAQKQREMAVAADFLNREIPRGRGDRLLLPNRRNEQLDWLFRDREIPEGFNFSEAFYLKEFEGVDFLELHPDWIIYLPHDYQFWGPDQMFAWLAAQDETTLQGVSIKLVMNTDLIRVFRVAYPPGHAPKAPLPPIP